jgi:VIT1/CCC1 family predicted Fe2+/Mn2+ transporter
MHDFGRMAEDAAALHRTRTRYLMSIEQIIIGATLTVAVLVFGLESGSSVLLVFASALWVGLVLAVRNRRLVKKAARQQ